MKITCPKCKARLIFPDEKLKPGGIRIKCSKCGAVLALKGKPKESSGVPLPQAPASEILPSPSGAEPFHAQPHSYSGPEDMEQPMPEDATSKQDIEAEPPYQKSEPQKPQFSEATKEGLKRPDESARTEKKSSALPADADRQRLPSKPVLIGAGAGVFLIILVAIFVFRSTSDLPDKKAAPTASSLEASGVQSSQQGASESGVQPASPSPETSQTAAASPATQPGPIFDMTDDKAIDIVKRSDALLKRTPVDSVVNKWATDNAEKLKVMGWQAKKINEQKYLVSYTAMDGDKTTGFYFEVDSGTGAVHDIGRNPDLQRQYNIQYNR